MSPLAAMTKWSPKQAMGTLRYLKFKLRMWTEIDTVPNWVEEAWRSGLYSKHSQERAPLDQIYRGDSLKYRAVFSPGGHVNQPETHYYAKIKFWWE